MKSYKKNNFLHSLFLHFLAALACSVVCSYPLWGNSLSSSMNHFCLISLPYMWSSFFNPKCIFVVVNVIVIFLLGESKLISTSSSIEGEIYNEYVQRSRSLRRISTPRQKTKDQTKPVKGELKEESMVEKKETLEEVKEIEEKVEDAKDIDEISSKEERSLKEEDQHEGRDGDVNVHEATLSDPIRVQISEDEQVEMPLAIVEKLEDRKEKEKREEDGGLPTDELNKRVEAFIARINQQRWIEANSIVCY